MKYVVQVEIDPDAGADAEEEPEKIQELMGKWQALNLIGMYFGVTRRCITIVLDIPNEDAMFEALHATWVLFSSYPEVWPVAGLDEFPNLLHRAGVGH